MALHKLMWSKLVTSYFKAKAKLLLINGADTVSLSEQETNGLINGKNLYPAIIFVTHLFTWRHISVGSCGLKKSLPEALSLLLCKQVTPDYC